MSRSERFNWQIGTGYLTGTRFSPPVTYGKVPEGIQDNGDAQPLKKGVEYTIVINVPYYSADKTSLTAVWVFK